jgi:hypothetical protein
MSACEEQLQAVKRQSWNAAPGTKSSAMDGAAAGAKAGRRFTNARIAASRNYIQHACDEPAANICMPNLHICIFIPY